MKIDLGVSVWSFSIEVAEEGDPYFFLQEVKTNSQYSSGGEGA